MKRSLKILSLMVGMFLFVGVVNAAEIPNSDFDDYNFYKCLIEAYNKKNTKEEEYTHNLTADELATIDNLSCSGKDKGSDEKINSVKGLDKLTKLTQIDLSYNNIKDINVSTLTDLTDLTLYNNKIEEIDVKSNTKLKTLSLYNNNLTTLDVTANEALTYLSLTNNRIGNIDLTKNTKLEYLSLGNNDLNSVDISKNIELTSLFLANNHFMAFDFSGVSKVKAKENINISPQTREFALTAEEGQYKLDIKSFDKSLDPEKVIFEDIDGVTYDKETGIFVFTKEIENISYNYKTGLPAEAGISENMEVKLTLTYPGKDEVNNYEDEKGEQKQTGSLTIGLITLLSLGGGLIYYNKMKNSNKLYKL